MNRKFLLFLLLYAFLQIGKAQTKHALIVAIGNYPATGGWPVISSSRDALYLKATLKKQGYEEKNIFIIKDSQATFKGINLALQSLISRVNKEDVALIHFSSHGQQLEDDNGDEADGLDEAIVSYDATRGQTPADYSLYQANYFRDDMFGTYVKQLRKKLGSGGDVLVLINACHSGSGTRGNTRIRGGKPALVSSLYNPAQFQQAENTQLFRETDLSDEEMATYIIISAARSGELDFEIKDEQDIGVGSLSYSFCKAVESIDRNTTYRSLFARIQSIMIEKSLRQHPVMEGNGLDRTLFGGRLVVQRSYVEIEKRISPREYIIKKGLLAGLDKGVRVALYPSGTLNIRDAKPLAEGNISRAGLFNANVKLSTDPRLPQITAGWVFVTEPQFGIKPVTLQVGENVSVSRGINYTEAELTTLKKELTNISLVSTNTMGDLLLKKGRRGDSLVINSNGLLLSTLPANDTAKIDWIKSSVQRYTQFIFLRDLELTDEKTSLTMYLVPFKNGMVDTLNTDHLVNNGIFEVMEGDSAVLKIKNNGRQSVFFNVLDLQPDGVINLLLPNKKLNVYPEDLKIKVGETLILDKYVFGFSPPYGTEVFKLFSSHAEIDLEELVTTEGRGGRGNYAFIEKLIKNTFRQNVRGGSITKAGSPEGTASSLIFIIKPRR